MKAAVSVLLSEVVRELFTGKELRKNSRISPERIDFSPNRTIVYTTQQAWVAQWIERGFPKPCVGGSIPLPGTIFMPENALWGATEYRSKIFHPPFGFLSVSGCIGIYRHISGGG